MNIDEENRMDIDRNIFGYFGFSVGVFGWIEV